VKTTEIELGLNFRFIHYSVAAATVLRSVATAAVAAAAQLEESTLIINI
jgi:hypothetical protein